MIAAAWRARTTREKLLIGAAGGLAAALFGVQLIVAPVLNGHAAAKSAYQRALADWTVVQDVVMQLGDAAGADESGDDPASLRAVIANTAAEYELNLARVQPSGEGALSVSLEDAESARVFRWLRALRNRHGVRVERASLRRSDRDAVVRVTLVLSTGGPR